MWFESIVVVIIVLGFSLSESGIMLSKMAVRTANSYHCCAIMMPSIRPDGRRQVIIDLPLLSPGSAHSSTLAELLL